MPAKVEGIERLMRYLNGRLVKVRSAKPQINVGYTAPYAGRIHEDLEMFHTNGQAKYLEQPARQMASELGGIVRLEVTNGVPFDMAIYKAGEALLEASQQLVPVDTGYLRDSGYVVFVGRE